jgi:hypothetical protein
LGRNIKKKTFYIRLISSFIHFVSKLGTLQGKILSPIVFCLNAEASIMYELINN